MWIRSAYWLTLFALALSASSRTAVESGSENQAIDSNGGSSGEAAGTTAGPSSDVPDTDASQVHIMQPGETLYSIAWRHELDLRDLITWNELQNPDLILAGQKLFLAPRTTTGTTPSAAQRPDTRLPESGSLWAWPVRGSIVSAYGASSGTGSGMESVSGGRSGQTPARRHRVKWCMPVVGWLHTEIWSSSNTTTHSSALTAIMTA